MTPTALSKVGMYGYIVLWSEAKLWQVLYSSEHFERIVTVIDWYEIIIVKICYFMHH